MRYDHEHCRARDTVLLPRNVHESIQCAGLKWAVPVFMRPLIDEEYGFANSVFLKKPKGH